MDKVEKLNQVIKQLKGVYKISINEEQKRRVEKEIRKLQLDLKEAESKQEEKRNDIDKIQEEEADTETETEKIKIEDYAIEGGEKSVLSDIETKKIHKNSSDEEINRLGSYLDEFENEYWVVLSEYHLDLDFNCSMERDTFYSKFENSKRSIKTYQKILDEYDRELSSDYLVQLNSMKNKQGRTLIIEISKLFEEIAEFVSKLVEDYKGGGNIILNPKQKLVFSNLEGSKKLKGETVIAALEKLYRFANEVFELANLPQALKKSINMGEK